MDQKPKRVVIVGVTGSGKTTLARNISNMLGIPHFELDAIHWLENWEPLPVDEFQNQVKRLLAKNTWVVDGNYGKVRDIIWGNADTVIWLDYSFPRIFYQLFQRTLRRVFLHEELWNKNKEHFRSQFLSSDSLFIWAIKTYPKRKKLYPELFSKAKFSHLNIVRLKSPNQTKQWLSSLKAGIL
jgi:adenylate kinase family enzyme